MARICLVTPSHPASNPRLVKEADALSSRGHEVHVVAGRYFPPLDPFDAALYARAAWSRTIVDYSGGPRVASLKILRRLARGLIGSRRPPALRTAILAQHPAIFPLADAAAARPADLYIGHTLAGLAAAGLAARRTGSRLGFDAEDFHPAETAFAETDAVESASIRRIEQEFLPRCRHLTAASPLIGRAYSAAYGLRELSTVLNVFPLSEAPNSPGPRETPEGLPLLYWFSQTIGPDRGLEALVAALGRLRRPCVLRLRGLPAPGFPEALRALARQSGFGGRLEFAPIAAPHEMARLAAGADLGLSLEQRRPRNRDLCLTNKIFTYLLAGTPVALTPTAAQSDLAGTLGAAALLLDPEDPALTAARLDAFLGDASRRDLATARAWRLAREIYNWDRESEILAREVRQALA